MLFDKYQRAYLTSRQVHLVLAHITYKRKTYVSGLPVEIKFLQMQPKQFNLKVVVAL